MHEETAIRIVATMWIRDGVLVDRMHINAVAFAYACRPSLEPQTKAKASLAELVNFALTKSGLSCLEKMRLFNLEVANVLANPEAAASLYNDIATEAARSAGYFSGAIKTLARLKTSGTKNFITSAVEQEVLDQWLHGEQGLETALFFDEILGRRDSFTKGADHFRYVANLVGGQPIDYIADAEFEIRQASALSQEFNLRPVGFAHHIDIEQIMISERLVRTACSALSFDAKCDAIDMIDCSKLVLPPLKTIRNNLFNAGAAAVVDDFAQLAKYLF